MMRKLLPFVLVFMTLGATAQIVNFPDANLKNKLVNYFPTIDTNGDGEIQVSEAAIPTDLMIEWENISDLTGMNAFTSLQRLDCSFNNLSTFHLSLPNLTALHCGYNPGITTLDLSGLPALTDLNCPDCSLTSLNLGTTPNLFFLSCNENMLTSLNISGLTNLYTANCSNNNLATLTLNNCPGLNVLYCQSNGMWPVSNHLTSLDLSGAPNLLFFNCDNNQLANLDFSNNTLIQQPTCRNNLLTSINVAGLTHLTDLIVTDNQLTSINVSGCSALNILYCENNQITSLDLRNCTALKEINATHNIVLTSLKIQGLALLTHVQVAQNQLDTLDVSAATGLQFFYCFNNQLKYINLKNGPGVPDINVANNPTLQYVCADEAELSSLQALIAQQGMPNVNINSYCNFTPGGNYNTMTGSLRLDADNNGCTVADPVLPQLSMKISDGTNTGYTFTNASGVYSFYGNAGNYTITPQTQNPYFTITPVSASLNFATAGPGSQTANFCITPNGVHNDLEISIIPVNPARPGFNASYKIVYKNKGTQTLSGNVELNFEGTRTSYVSATPAVTTQTANLLSWTYSNLVPFETRSIDVIFTILPPPTNNINDILSYAANITPLAGDETPLDNGFTMKQVLVGSFDPNDKTCMEGPKIAITRVGDYVHYMVRFQNTGTFVAENVVVKDILQGNLDPATVELVKTSHPCVFRQTNGNKLEFIFQGINLPAESVDEPGSHGYVVFKVKTINSLVVGSQVDNNASIYFDFNLPVITNTASAVISSDIIIPISIEYFKGAIQSGNHLLNWKANCTSTQAVFNIERSTDGRKFTSLQSITASNTRCLQPFDYTDNDPVAGMNYYRIRMTDVDGKVSYSTIIALLNKQSGFEIVNLLPNPVTDGTALLNITSASKQTINIKVSEASGKIVQIMNKPVIAGFTQLNMNFGRLAAGVYTISIYTNDSERKTRQFVKE